MKKPIGSKKGVSLLLTMLLVVTVLASAELVFFSFVANLNLSKYYENSLQVFYDLESAKIACLWEEAHASSYNSWDTDTSDMAYDSTCRLKGASIENYNGKEFYVLDGYNARTRVINNGGEITMYTHAYKGSLANPLYSRYAEYLYKPSPLYQYYIFSNKDLEFQEGLLYQCRGGKIHSNGNITFLPDTSASWSEYGIRFDQLLEMTANGTIQYEQKEEQYPEYPAPEEIDWLDGYDENGDQNINETEIGYGATGKWKSMAPAPYAPTIVFANGSRSQHDWTTDGYEVIPGPFRQWGYYYGWRLFERFGAGKWLGGFEGEWNYEPDDDDQNAPLLWRGEETFFRGKQYSGSGYNSYQLETHIFYLAQNGSSNSSDIYPAGQKALTIKYPLFNTSGSLNTVKDINGSYFTANVMFKPYKDSAGNLNNVTWLEIPAALPQAYYWEDKYEDSPQGVPVKFYATQKCIRNSTINDTDCIVENWGGNPANYSLGWRYMRKYTANGTICTDNACYNDTLNTSYVLAQDYLYPGNRTYFSYVNPKDGDRNSEVLDDPNYTYGDDVNNTDPNNPDRQIHIFNSEKQKYAFLNDYLAKLSEEGFQGVLNSGVPRKEFNLGQLFNTYYSDGSLKEESRYCIMAKQAGVYVPKDINQAIANFGNLSGTPVARSVEFYNFRTAKVINNVIEVDIGLFRNTTRTPTFNGIIYSQLPLRFSNATNLPGENIENKKAVFTVLCEESIYLKGDYNLHTGAGLPPYADDTWKLSHLVSKKIIYGLSNNFQDQDHYSKAPDFGVYNQAPHAWDWYPFVYLKLQGGECQPEEGDPTLNNGEWVFPDKYNTLEQIIANNPCIPDNATASWAHNYVYNVTQPWWSNNSHRLNRVDKNNYTYNSLFITPYNFGQYVDAAFYPNAGSGVALALFPEIWQWYGTSNNVYINGAFIYLYDPDDPDFDDEYYTPLYTSGDDSTMIEDPFNYRRGAAYTGPALDVNNECGNEWSIRNFGGGIDYTEYYWPNNVYQAYDARFPQSSPLNQEAVLGLTGESIWREVSGKYFEEKI